MRFAKTVVRIWTMVKNAIARTKNEHKKTCIKRGI